MRINYQRYPVANHEHLSTALELKIYLFTNLFFMKSLRVIKLMMKKNNNNAKTPCKALAAK